MRARAPLAALTAEADGLKAEVDAAARACEEARAQLQAKRERLAECDAEIKALEKALTKIRKAQTDVVCDKKKREHKCAALAGGRGRLRAGRRLTAHGSQLGNITCSSVCAGITRHHTSTHTS